MNRFTVWRQNGGGNLMGMRPARIRVEGAGIRVAARYSIHAPSPLMLWVVLSLILLSGCRSPAATTATPTPSATQITSTVATIDSSIRALGTLRPAKKLSLSFQVSGNVSALDLQIGQQVKAGELLASLSTVEIERAIESAKAGVEIQTAELVILQGSAESIEAKQAASENAYQLAQAEIALNVAKLNLEHRQLNIPAAGLTNAQSAQEAAQVKILENDVATARLALEKLQAWQNPYTVDQSTKTRQANARLLQAQLEVERLQAQLANAQIISPFDGTISAINRQIGEWTDAGTIVIDLIDTTAWIVETKNIGEQKIGQITVGQKATVTATIFTDQPIEGEVLSIAPVATVQQGDTTYTLLIKLAQTDLPLRSGMNTQVEIMVE